MTLEQTMQIRRRGWHAAAVSLSVALLGGGCREAGLRVTPLASPQDIGESTDPALAVDPGTGDLLLAWARRDDSTWTLVVARSRDGGASWSTGVPAAGGPAAPHEVHPHGESSAKLVAAPGGRLALVWPNSVPVAGRKWPAAMMRFTRSTDGGRTWAPPITLNDDTTGAPVSHQFHGAAWQGDSGLVVAWLDERPGPAPSAATASDPTSEPDAAIFAVESPDFGGRWSANRRLWGAACPCCRITLARETGGEVIAAWRQHFPGNIRDVVVAPVGTPLGERSAEPARVHEDGWVYAGCPHTGPGVAAAAAGGVHTVWYTGREGRAGIYYARAGAGAQSAAPVALVRGAVSPAHAVVAGLADGGAIAAYDVDATGARTIRVARLGPDGRVHGQATVPGSAGGSYPQLAVLPGGGAVVAYSAGTPERRTVRLARLELP
ncbi:MAG TPA: hypothetical protein VFS11_00260 [Gemmatimonadales bacterium]|nr:hypothetical protein [Gemmatimonadales bacterium]